MSNGVIKGNYSYGILPEECIKIIYITFKNVGNPSTKKGGEE
jgi:hypothetical protein